MNIALYVQKSDAYDQMEQVLRELMLPYQLYFTDELLEADVQVGKRRSPVLVIDGRCTFLSPHIEADEFRMLVHACIEAAEIAHHTGRDTRRK